jgi:Co/Zn/Cd efflux system component
MQRKLLIAATIANVGMIIAAAVIFFSIYSTTDKLLAALLFLPPLLSILALCKGPDKEERELDQAVRKARLRKELKDLQETK